MPPRTPAPHPTLLELPHLALVKHGHVFDPAKHQMTPGTRLTVAATDIRYVYAPPLAETFAALVTGDGTEHIVAVAPDELQRQWALALRAQVAVVEAAPAPESAAPVAVPAVDAPEA